MSIVIAILKRSTVHIALYFYGLCCLQEQVHTGDVIEDYKGEYPNEAQEKVAGCLPAGRNNEHKSGYRVIAAANNRS